MIYEFDDILTADELAKVISLVSSGTYHEGARGAGWQARSVKHNEELDAKITQQVGQIVGQALARSAKFKALAWPKRLAGFLVSRYTPGMTYGTHVDNAILNNARSDMSFTLFLSDPDTYTGGELVIEQGDTARIIKPAKGHMVLYSTSALHHVAEVTKGERLAVVGWVRSYVRDPQAREMLYDLDLVMLDLKDKPKQRAVLDRVSKVRTNLLRRWMDD